MDRAKCQAIRADLEALSWAFADIEKKHGVKVAIGTASYVNDAVGNTSFKVEFNEVASDGLIVNPEVSSFKANARMYGLSPDDLGATFYSGGKTFKIIGLKPRARRMPILAECGGKRYKFASEIVVAMLGRKGKSPLFASVSTPAAPSCDDDNDDEGQTPL